VPDFYAVTGKPPISGSIAMPLPAKQQAFRAGTKMASIEVAIQEVPQEWELKNKIFYFHFFYCRTPAKPQDKNAPSAGSREHFRRETPVNHSPLET